MKYFPSIRKVVTSQIQVKNIITSTKFLAKLLSTNHRYLLSDKELIRSNFHLIISSVHDQKYFFS
jgi:hypothetical protein